MTPVANAPLKILAVGAHPDDIEFGVGGLLLREHADGAEIHLIVTSHGESGSYGTPGIRAGETAAAAQMIDSAHRVTFLDFGGDGQQVASPENITTLARAIREIRPDLILAPTLTSNQHPDHSTVGAICRDASRIARYGGFPDLIDLPPHSIGSLWFYSITPTSDLSLTGSVLVDISLFHDRWIKMMNCHQSQTSRRNYVELQTSRARQLGLLAGCENAIALWPNDPPVIDGIHSVARTARAF